MPYRAGKMVLPESILPSGTSAILRDAFLSGIIGAICLNRSSRYSERACDDSHTSVEPEEASSVGRNSHPYISHTDARAERNEEGSPSAPDEPGPERIWISSIPADLSSSIRWKICPFPGPGDILLKQRLPPASATSMLSGRNTSAMASSSWRTILGPAILSRCLAAACPRTVAEATPATVSIQAFQESTVPDLS
ncbi:MAG: hypothetical protein BWX47_01795 [candidate division Hyd24-12 bacterium ADurb.Bin004]|nr:MAG: hypothetical protein BWX47_01795 [candidate division Hyd24-12 bacterium ADurb.Bin004]